MGTFLYDPRGVAFTSGLWYRILFYTDKCTDSIQSTTDSPEFDSAPIQFNFSSHSEQFSVVYVVRLNQNVNQNVIKKM